MSGDVNIFCKSIRRLIYCEYLTPSTSTPPGESSFTVYVEILQINWILISKAKLSHILWLELITVVHYRFPWQQIQVWCSHRFGSSVPLMLRKSESTASFRMSPAVKSWEGPAGKQGASPSPNVTLHKRSLRHDRIMASTCFHKRWKSIKKCVKTWLNWLKVEMCSSVKWKDKDGGCLYLYICILFLFKTCLSHITTVWWPIYHHIN